MSRYILMSMSAFKWLTDKYRGKVGEDIRLDKCHQALQQVNEYGQRQEEGRCAIAQVCVHGAEYEYETDKAEDDDMPRNHVGKQTYHQRKGLGEMPMISTGIIMNLTPRGTGGQKICAQ